MRYFKIFPPFLAFLLTGCALMQPSPPIDASSKTDVALLKYKKIAVIKLKNPKNDAAGQDAADILALGFVKLGYNVVSSPQSASLIDQSDVYVSGLTPDIKTKLKSFGVDSLVTGTINEYLCSSSEAPLPLLKQCGENHCSVTASARMIDLDSGEIVWGAIGSDAQEGRWVTADSVLISVMEKMRDTIPNITLLRSTVSSTRGKSQAQSQAQPQAQPQAQRPAN